MLSILYFILTGPENTKSAFFVSLDQSPVNGRSSTMSWQERRMVTDALMLRLIDNAAILNIIIQKCVITRGFLCVFTKKKFEKKIEKKFGN
jgi:hypothetical protein